MGYADPARQKAHDAARERTKEPGYENAKTARRAMYADRKERQVCVDCEGSLAPDDGLRCVRCAGNALDAKLLYEASPKGRRAKARWRRKEEKRRKKNGLCSDCKLPRAQWSKTPPRKARPPDKVSKFRCPDCRAIKSAATARYRARKAQGVIVLATVRKERARAKHREMHTYRPFDEVVSIRDRILKRLAWLEWPSTGDLLDALEVPDHAADPRTRNAYSVTLSRLVRESGFIERRRIRVGKVVSAEINLTDSGRAYVKGLA